MLLRYNYEGLPQLEEVRYCKYNIKAGCAIFYSDDAVITAQRVDPSRWRMFTGDMFVDGKLAIPEDFPITRGRRVV